MSSWDELIEQVQAQIVTKTNEFQTWLLNNPSATAGDTQLQSLRQELKMLNLRLDEYKRQKDDYDASIVPEKTGAVDLSYTKPRNSEPVASVETSRVVVGRSIMKIAK